LRVLHVNKFLYRRGGAESYMFDLAKLQTDAGDQVAFFGMDHPDNLPMPYASHFPSYVEFRPAAMSMGLLIRGTARMLYSRSAEVGIGCRQRQIGAGRERQICSVVIREAMCLSENWQLEYFQWGLLGGIDGKGLQSGEETVDLIEGDALAAVGHEKTVADLIEPERGDQSTFFRKACEDAEAVVSAGFVFQEPLEGERCIQHQITHRRWPS